MNFWQQRGAQMSAADIMEYDPYLGRVTESTQKPS